jgi:hypothetical protein
MTSLRHLKVACHPVAQGVTGAELGAALRPLHQLTCLLIRADALVQALPALSGCAGLQRCMFMLDDLEAAVEPGLLPGSGIPSGAWLSSLRWLHVNFALLANSMEPLSHTHLLEYLSINVPTPTTAQLGAHSAFWIWAVRHPPLRRLGLEFEEYTDEAPFPYALLHAILCLVRQRPCLAVVVPAGPACPPLRRQHLLTSCGPPRRPPASLTPLFALGSQLSIVFPTHSNSLLCACSLLQIFCPL